MSGIPLLPYLLVVTCMASAFWPGFDFRPPAESPKKGYWTVANVFWPLRKAYLDRWPGHAALGKAARESRVAAGLLAAAVLLFLCVPGTVKAVDPRWYIAETAIVAFLIGRASGFLGAARVIDQAKQQDRAPDQVPEPPRN